MIEYSKINCGSQPALSNSYPNACVPMKGGNLYHFYDGLWYDPAGA